ncbi:acireductone synthase [Streptomyces sioyaensis]|uniref:Enolase-phosphatase E1 n=1 Tax=Streptomyces sioyaensis TaxID=67364 RepID=A0A4V1NPK4_9ACTN|nr:acireductone synthase [Streptomyces sioyaensis]MBM4792844.1 acireductone synthase [Streptomyces sioyaensis]RXS65130.1 acireductone synthase [Streptomyces sioyaensis]
MTAAAVVLDVEGTTSATEHVYGVLFPYARARIADWVAEHGHEKETRAILDDVDRIGGRPAGGDDKEAVRALTEWADADRKVAPLKELQGLIWTAGYDSGELSGHVYADTLLALRKWLNGGAQIYIYSSGSVQAQRQLFAHTQFGDLRSRLSGHFDTRTAGGKRSPDSYRAITRSVGVPVRQVLFASDTVAELDAARTAGWRTAWVVRPEEGGPADSARPPATGHPVYRNLLAVAEEAQL